MTITIYRQTRDGRLWQESVCETWERALSFIPNWGHVWISVGHPEYDGMAIIYGQRVGYTPQTPF